MNPLENATTINPHVGKWVARMAELCEPEQVHWCDGSDAEKVSLTRLAVAADVLVPLDQARWPGCYHHRSSPNDVARVEQCTFICTESAEEAGVTNNWAPPGEMYDKLHGLLGACRT
ncbi:MAG: phosphoenolpyruvate carboxykinase (GTP) [Pedosphaera sp.]|nr:phosphoenolpyruvate carboxykinase (GTP) [Pedosphaera sp.]